MTAYCVRVVNTRDFFKPGDRVKLVSLKNSQGWRAKDVKLNGIYTVEKTGYDIIWIYEVPNAEYAAWRFRKV